MSASKTASPAQAAIYCRISDDRTGQMAGVTRQQEDCMALAERRGWSVAETFIDNDISAYNGKRRPAYAKMLAAIEGDEIGAVVAWHPDRLYRRLQDLEQLISLAEDRRVEFATVTAGDIDLATPTGRMNARVTGTMNRYESEHKGERIRRKHEELARAGKGKGGGTRPFGFNEDRLTIREAEAALIREAAGRVALGTSYRRIVREWNEAGVRSSSGGRWSSSSLARMLRSPRTAGLRAHRGEVVATAVWPAIIDRATYERLQSLRRNGVAPARRYVLNSLAYCGLCGAKLVARPKMDGRPCYVCASDFGGCGKIRQLAEPLEDFVRDAVLMALDSSEFRRALRQAREGGKEAELLKAISRDEEGLEQAAKDHYVDRIISRSAFLAAKEGLERRLEASRAALARSAGSMAIPSGAKALQAAWESHDVAWRRSLIAAVIEKVVLRSAVVGRNFFDPARVEMIWRA